MERPIIGIPIGDPAGIGPEIVLKALGNKGLYEICKPLVIGDINILKRIDRLVNSGLDFNVISDPGKGQYQSGCIDLISCDSGDAKSIKYGKIQARRGKRPFNIL